MTASTLTTSAQVAWYLTDNLGSVRQLVDTGGTVKDAIAYDSFERRKGVGSLYGEVDAGSSSVLRRRLPADRRVPGGVSPTAGRENRSNYRCVYPRVRRSPTLWRGSSLDIRILFAALPGDVPGLVGRSTATGNWPPLDRG